MKRFGMGFVVIIAILVIILSRAAFIVDEREEAIVFKFGEIIRSDIKPGLHFMLPLVNNVKLFDSRIQTLDAEPQQYLTGEKKNLYVDSFVKWRIREVKSYYTRLNGSQSNARSRIAQRVNDSLRQEFGRRTVKEVISGDRAAIMDNVRRSVDEEVQSLGIEVIDVRLKRVDFSNEISDQVYRRMRAERTRVAKELRAQGEEEAEKIRADADRKRQVMLANAEREAQQVRGAGDARATGIYAEAYGKDEEFYSFYRSLNAYRKTFNGGDDLLVLDPSSEFFKFFKQTGGDEQ